MKARSWIRTSARWPSVNGASKRGRFLNESELTERRAFIESFVKGVVARPGNAVVPYTIPMPDDCLIPRGKAEEALDGSVLSTIKNGEPAETRSGRSPVTRCRLPNPQPTSTAVFRCDCVATMERLREGTRPKGASAGRGAVWLRYRRSRKVPLEDRSNRPSRRPRPDSAAGTRRYARCTARRRRK